MPSTSCARTLPAYADPGFQPAESFVLETVKDVVNAHGKTLTPEAVQASTGRRPLEAWQAVKEVLDIDSTAKELFDESEPILTERCSLTIINMQAACFKKSESQVSDSMQQGLWMITAADALSTLFPTSHTSHW